MKKLEGKVALVTGSGRGIGQEIALKLASEGAHLVINDLDDEPAADTLAKIEAMGAKAVACNGDVTAKDFGERYVQTALEAFGTPDIIINNAGYSWDSVVQKHTDEQFQAMIDVHTVAPFRILRAAAEPIRIAAKKEAKEGREVFRKVVNISSTSGLFGNAGQISYAAGKSAVVGMTKTLAKEWGRYKVNVNCVAFGYIQTRMTKPIGSGDEIAQVGDREIAMGIRPEAIAFMQQMIPLGRGGYPEEAAGAVYLFCTPESNYISGQVLVAGGGLAM